MKERFYYTSNLCYVFLVPVLLTIFIAVPMMHKGQQGTGNIFGVLFLLCFVCFLVSCFVPCSFEAREKEVRFTRAFLKTDVIKYSDIKGMDITRDHYNTRYGTKWVETISFALADKELSFRAAMDIDYDRLSQDPDELGRQFENSKFSQLKNYIEDRMT